MFSIANNDTNDLGLGEFNWKPSGQTDGMEDYEDESKNSIITKHNSSVKQTQALWYMLHIMFEKWKFHYYMILYGPYISAERSLYKGQGHTGDHGWVVNSDHSMDLKKYECR